jgi:hypothetical protein
MTWSMPLKLGAFLMITYLSAKINKYFRMPMNDIHLACALAKCFEEVES